MGLTNIKEEQLKEMPQIKNRMFISEDGKFFVHTTTITHIKPVAYVQKVLDNSE